MKKFAFKFLLTLIATAVLAVAPVTQVAYAAEPSDSPVMVLSATTNGNEVTVEADLKMNTGIFGMTLELVYDESVMTLTGVEKGEALSALEPIWTNGYDVRPFVINWLDTKNKVNDTSTGIVLRMHFLIKETAPDGIYSIKLIGTDNQSVTYLDGNKIKAKSILIDDVKIKIEGDVAEAVDNADEEKPETRKTDVALIVTLSAVGAVVVATIVVLIVIFVKKKKGKKGKDRWEKVE